MRKCAIITIAFWWALCLPCCKSSNDGIANVTHRDDLWGGYGVDRKYRTVQPVFIIAGRDGHMALVAPSSVRSRSATFENVPETVDEYRRATNRWPAVRGVAEAGQKFRTTALYMYSTTTYSTVYVHGQLINGPFAGEDVGLNGVSRPWEEDVTLWEPDAAIIEGGEEQGSGVFE